MKFCFFIFFFISSKLLAIPLDTIKIATYIEPPLSNIINGQLVGRNINIANLMASQLNKQVVYIECPLARCMSMMQIGQTDMIISIRKTPEREEYLTYLEPSFFEQHLPVNFFIQKNSPLQIVKYDDLKPLLIGTIRGSTYFDQFDNDVNLNKVEVTSRPQLIEMLMKGRIDTFIAREESILPLIDKQVYLTAFSLASYQYDKFVSSYIAISKKSPLNNEISLLNSTLLKLINNGEIHKALSY